MSGDGPTLDALARAARRAERRIRLGRALDAGIAALAAALAGAAMVLALRKTEVVSEAAARGALLGLAGATLAAAIAGWARRLPPRAGAVALDRHHGLAGRVGNALAFAEAAEADRTPLMRAAIEDGALAAGAVDPRQAVPLRAPRELPLAAVLLAGVVLLGLLEVRRHLPPRAAETIDAVDVTADDLDAMREFLIEAERRAETEDAKADVQAFNQLIEDLAAKRLDRTEAFRRMEALEQKLLEGREGDAKALEDALRKIGEELKKAELTRPAGEALETKNLAVAEKALRELAKKLREKGAGADKAQLERMRDALKRAAEAQDKRAEALAKRRDDLRKELLAKKEARRDGGAAEEERSLLTKKERELERLERDAKEAEAAQRSLERLDRELAQAAEDLMRDLGVGAQDLEQGAEDVNRMARQEMTQQEKEQLRQKLEELRETLRQQGKGGKPQMARLRKFQQAARQGLGGGKQRGPKGDEGEDGQGGSEPGEGKDREGEGEGAEGQGQKGQGQNGPGKGGAQGETWVLGPGGEKMLMLSRGQGQSGAGGGKGGQGDEPGGKGAGTGHDGNVQGKPTGPVGKTSDTQVAGQDTGQGASRSEVIEGAAERGFASRGYQKVYREYHTVAEEALARDEIPGGYRFYVKRYFQLIRPREPNEKP